jgi:hypothetical protein
MSTTAIKEVVAAADAADCRIDMILAEGAKESATENKAAIASSRKNEFRDMMML